MKYKGAMIGTIGTMSPEVKEAKTPVKAEKKYSGKMDSLQEKSKLTVKAKNPKNPKKEIDKKSKNTKAPKKSPKEDISNELMEILGLL